ICCMEGVLDRVMQMNPIQYRYRADQKEKRKHLGFGAQEVKEVFPELVHYSEEKDLYSLNYGNLGAINTAAIKETNHLLRESLKEQQQVNERQQKEIEELQEIIKALTAPTKEKLSKLFKSFFKE
ncbi:tail fiber domain-containing protein, partial [Xanthovirga aplysinae]|uniref:tail fiber domain-containing protein n=1 Tax=Xanthovirga aplysinae TaxID=2529853 RepID=UPI001656D06E